MAWTINFGGIDPDWILPDTTVDFIQKQMGKASKDGEGFWIYVGDQFSEGSQKLFWTPGIPTLFTRTENDPSELNYVFESGPNLAEE